MRKWLKSHKSISEYCEQGIVNKSKLNEKSFEPKVFSS